MKGATISDESLPVVMSFYNDIQLAMIAAAQSYNVIPNIEDLHLKVKFHYHVLPHIKSSSYPQAKAAYFHMA